MPRVGLISDTHGLLRPEAINFLRNSNAELRITGASVHARIVELELTRA